MLTWYMGATAISSEELEAAVSKMDADSVRIALAEISELRDAMEAELAEAELTAILEENGTFVQFAQLLDAQYQGGNLLSTLVTVLDGQVSVEDSQGKAKVSDGVVTVDATGSLMKEQTNVVTVTNETNGPATLTFTYGVVKHTGITIADQAVNDTGVYTALLSAGGSVTIKVKTKSTATLTLSNISLVPAAEASDITFVYDSTMGSVAVDGAAVSNGHVAEQVTLADGVLLNATVTGENVVFLGWMNVETGNLLSDQPSYRLRPAAKMTVKAVFVSTTGNAWFRVDNKLFQDLNEANAFAENNVVKTIVLAADGVLPAGSYTISSGVTLLIPFDAERTL
jgi:hypothetical protein